MPFRRPRAETPFETLQPLSGQRDLRQQDEGLSPGAQGRCHRFEIDFGLARPGHTVEHGHAAFAGARDQRLGRRALVGREIGAGARAVGQAKDRRRRQRHGVQQPRLGHGFDHAGPHARLARQFGRGTRRPIGQHRQDAPARRRQLGIIRRLACQTPGGQRARRLECGRNAHRHAQHRAGRGQGISRHPIDEPAADLGQRRQVQLGDDGLQPGLGNLARAGTPDDADLLALSQRHDDEIAGHRILAAIVVTAGQRQGQQDGKGLVGGGVFHRLHFSRPLPIRVEDHEVLHRHRRDFRDQRSGRHRAGGRRDDQSLAGRQERAAISGCGEGNLRDHPRAGQRRGDGEGSRHHAGPRPQARQDRQQRRGQGAADARWAEDLQGVARGWHPRERDAVLLRGPGHSRRQGGGQLYLALHRPPRRRGQRWHEPDRRHRPDL